MNITVVTAISGGKDKLVDHQNKGTAQFVAYLDEPQNSPTWQIRPAYDRFKDNRRNSRVPKILIHQYVDTEYSVYIDGNMQLLMSPDELIAKYLTNHDLAVFKHPNRDCIYDEAMQCAKQHLDDPEIIIEQAKHYEDHGFAKHKGLCECGVILRRHTPVVERFNNAWWSEYTRFSRRDQISFMYAADSVGIRINVIPDYFIITDSNTAIKQSGDIKVTTHQHFL